MDSSETICLSIDPTFHRHTGIKAPPAGVYLRGTGRGGTVLIYSLPSLHSNVEVEIACLKTEISIFDIHGRRRKSIETAVRVIV